ncbi:sel1 repeat family protein [Shewanella waksmanii]|uniref:tetratricopeptide repeat protein n=1 Tax=Shewanella waksmanii TaxID=213783 RepID=UPI003734D0D9
MSLSLVCGIAATSSVQAFSLPQPENEVKASKLAHIEVRANHGDAEAEFLLGLMYLSGRFVTADRDLGLAWMQRAAEQGHEKAQQTLADLTFEGNIVSRNLAMAERWYLSLSEQGSKWAEFRLGFIYAAGGKGVERNCGKAVERFNAVGDDVSLGNVAWILATCPEAEYRDGNKAVEIAQSLVKLNEQDPTNLDNLAAAYAELGDFQLAVKTQQKAIDALKQTAEINRSDEFEARLQTYQAKQPYREVIPLGE